LVTLIVGDWEPLPASGGATGVVGVDGTPNTALAAAAGLPVNDADPRVAARRLLRSSKMASSGGAGEASLEGAREVETAAATGPAGAGTPDVDTGYG
jgi:hypothetical protein